MDTHTTLSALMSQHEDPHLTRGHLAYIIWPDAMTIKEVIMSVSIAEAKGRLSDLIKQARDEPVVITRRGRPDAVIMSFEDYQLLHRVRAYLEILRLSQELQNVQVTATELHESSRRELEERP